MGSTVGESPEPACLARALADWLAGTVFITLPSRAGSDARTETGAPGPAGRPGAVSGTSVPSVPPSPSEINLERAQRSLDPAD
jgi:hypothetical protein